MLNGHMENQKTNKDNLLSRKASEGTAKNISGSFFSKLYKKIGGDHSQSDVHADNNFEKLKNFAEEGKADCQFLLGWMFQIGDEVPKDEVKATE